MARFKPQPPVVDTDQMLSRDEVNHVLRWLEMQISHEARPARDRWSMSRALFRLALLGMRNGEIRDLTIKQVRLEGDKPVILLKDRVVPVWWSRGAVIDLRDWMKRRELASRETGMREQGPDDPFICTQRNAGTRFGRKVRSANMTSRFKTCVNVLGKKRAKGLCVTSGRITFVAMSLLAGRSVHSILKACGMRYGGPVHLFRAAYIEQVGDTYGV